MHPILEIFFPQKLVVLRCERRQKGKKNTGRYLVVSIAAIVSIVVASLLVAVGITVTTSAVCQRSRHWNQPKYLRHHIIAYSYRERPQLQP